SGAERDAAIAVQSDLATTLIVEHDAAITAHGNLATTLVAGRDAAIIVQGDLSAAFGAECDAAIAAHGELAAALVADDNLLVEFGVVERNSVTRLCFDEPRAVPPVGIAGWRPMFRIPQAADDDGRGKITLIEGDEHFVTHFWQKVYA